MWQAFEREEKTKGVLGAQARRLLSNLQIQPYLLAPRSSLLAPRSSLLGTCGKSLREERGMTAVFVDY